MTTINPSLYSGQYYQLGSTNTGTSSGSTTTSSGSATPSLASALASLTSASSSTSDSSSSYLLDLSPEAQSYMNSSSASTSTTSSTGSNFLLSNAQKQKLNEIIESFKDKPVTQENYDALQQALKDAGLGPDQMSLKDHVQNFSATRMLIDALSGNGSDAVPDTSIASIGTEEQDKANSYMSGILKQWQAIAPAATAAADSDS